MKEEIEAILNDETIENNKDKVDAIAKVIPLFTVPKDKYNGLSDRLQKIEIEKSTIESQYKELQQKNMSAEELREAKLKELEERETALAKRESENVVTTILANAGLTKESTGEDDYKSLVEDLIGNDQADSERKANNFINFMSKQKELVEKETTTKLLNETPKPNTGSDGEESVTQEDFDKMTYTEMLDFKEKNPELYEEFSKE